MPRFMLPLLCYCTLIALHDDNIRSALFIGAVIAIAVIAIAAIALLRLQFASVQSQ